MLTSILFGLLAAGQSCLAVSGLRRWSRVRDRLVLVPTVLCAALVYDNAVIALGATTGPGTALMVLSVPRFVLHALLTPVLVLWCHALLTRAGPHWANRPRVAGGARILTAVLIALGVHHDVLGLSLEPHRWAGSLRYVNDAQGIGPLPAVVTGIVVLASGVLLARLRGTWVLAAAALVMVLVSAAAAQVPVLGNAGEVVLDAGLLATAFRYASADPGGARLGRV